MAQQNDEEESVDPYAEELTFQEISHLNDRKVRESPGGRGREGRMVAGGGLKPGPCLDYRWRCLSTFTVAVSATIFTIAAVSFASAAAAHGRHRHHHHHHHHHHHTTTTTTATPPSA